MILICGLPNSGKTTYSNKFENVLHYDEIRLNTRLRHKIIIEIAEAQKGDVCIEGVYGERKRRRELVEAMKRIGAKSTCIWLNAPVEECLKREKKFRQRPDTIVTAHAKAFEPPTKEEGWDKIIVI